MDNARFSHNIPCHSLIPFHGFDQIQKSIYWYEIEEAIEQGIVNPPSESRSVFTNKELQADYGLTYDEAYIVRVCSRAEYDTIQFGENVHITNGSIGNFEVAKIGKKWYVLRIDHAWDSDWCE